MNNQTIEKLRSLRLGAMASLHLQHVQQNSFAEMTCDEYLSLLTDHQWEDRENAKIERLLKQAAFRQQASLADISYSGDRNLDRNMFARLATLDFISRKENIIICGASGTGKSYLLHRQKDELQEIEKELPSAIFKTELNRLWCLALDNSSKLALTVEYMSKYNISQDSAASIVSNASVKLDDLKSEAQRALMIDEDIFELEDFVRHRKSLLPISNDQKLFDEFNLAFELNQKILKLKDADDLVIKQTELANMEQNRYKPILQKNMAFVQAKFGKELPNFSFSDLKNDLNFLDAYKDKIVYIELWATWCGPCIKLKPDLYRLHDLYNDEQNVVILSISIDQDKESWKQYVTKHQSPLTEWHANNEFTDYFQVTTIPRAILIGRDGEILEWNAPKPNDIGLRKKIDELIYNDANGYKSGKSQSLHPQALLTKLNIGNYLTTCPTIETKI